MSALPATYGEISLDIDSLSVADFEFDATEHTGVLAPWEESPRSLVSWYDMLHFSARAYFWIGTLLESLISDCVLKPGDFGDQPMDVRVFHEPIDAATRQKAIKSLKLVEEQSTLIGMIISADTAREIKTALEDGDRCDYLALVEHVKSIKKLLWKEMKGKTFIYLSAEQMKFWPKVDPPAFGAEAAKAFPSALYDSTEAGLSLALNRSTACVFHLMRVLEVGLSVLGKVFNVSLSHTNWAPAIDEIESKIRTMHKDPAWKALPDCKDQQEFYAQAASHFGVLKDAWRNYTAHARGKYTTEEAGLIFNNVRAFMQKLSERLSE